MQQIRNEYEEVELARTRLSAFVRSEAERTANELGFEWRPADLAPMGLEMLTTELRSSHLSGLPFRVYGGFSDDTVYDTKETNLAFRFWHDTRHVWLGADFTPDAELEVASCHLAQAKAAGFERRSIEFQLLYADTAGQTLFTSQAHRFVVHQRQFALDYVRGGLDFAIEHELRATLIAGTVA
jgi:hypothetical protein